MNFSYTIVSRKETLLAGISVKTNCQNAHNDCPKLWKTFRPIIESIYPKPYAGTPSSYGVSIMNSVPSTFTYWAAIGISTLTTLPGSVSSLTLPKGHYLHCTVPSIDLVSAAFDDMYKNWQQNQKEFILDMALPCFEEYTSEYFRSGSTAIYAPVKQAG